jgi:hypothetical protein
MRSLTVVTLFAFAASPALAADKDEDKAKEAAVAFLKAVKAKDADAVLKTAELPFLTMVDGSPMVFEKAADLKADLKAKLDTIKDADKVPTEIERIAPFADLKDKIKDEDRRKAVEKVMGDGGFVAFVKTADDKTVVILVRLKDGKAKVVGFGQH